MSDIFDESVTFADLGLRDSVLRGVEACGFKHPTDIQVKLIRPALAGKDLIGQAKTGTGKTAAFGLPILHHADPDLSGQALVLTPTRELAAQVASELEELGKHTPIRTTCIIGGESFKQQQQSMKEGGHIIVGTPGRVMDMQQRGTLSFANIRFVVLDEVDRMLDIGFRDDIRQILSRVKSEHQTMFVSATVSEEIERLARKFMTDDAEKIMTVSGSLTVSQVDQKYISVEPWDKKQLMLHLMRHEDIETVVVFCRTKATVRNLSRYLRDKGIAARDLHGDMAQQKRTKVMNSLRQGNVNVLIASDLAARGLDVEHITHVINYDLPEDPEVYVHRIGRTARAGRRGVAWSFVTPEDGALLTQIEKLTGVMIEKLEYESFKPGPVPEDAQRERASRKKVAASREEINIKEKLADRETTAVNVEGLSQEDLEKMFPGGVIPKSKPKRGLGSRFRRRR